MAEIAFQQIGENIWVSEGDTVSVLGFRYGTRMALIQLNNGEVLVWSPTALTAETPAMIASLGRVAHIVAPNSLHHLYLGAWQSAFPDARLYAAPHLAKKRKDLKFDEMLGEEPPTAWGNEIDQVVVRGNLITTEVVFFHRASRTALFTDLLQSFPDGWFTGWRRIVARLDGLTSPTPQTPKKFKVAFTDRAMARRAIKQICEWPSEQVLMAHGAPIRENGAVFLKRAFEWL